jgi:hypothetical protein
MGLALAGTGVVWHAESRRLKERELLFAGEQYRRAIGLYYEHSPGVKKYPPSVGDLLLDTRYPVVQRYLRRAYADPVTGSPEWGIVEGPEGGIAGVYSLSADRPVKRTHFRAGQADFEGREAYREWRFVYAPQESPADEAGTGRKD